MKKWLIIGGVVILILAIGVPWLLLANGWHDEVRDLAIILVALFHLISVTIMIILLAVILVIVNELRSLAKDKIEPQVRDVMENVKGITENAKSTSVTAKQAASYIAEGVVSPVIKAAGLMAGVKAGAKALARQRKPDLLPYEDPHQE